MKRSQHHQQKRSNTHCLIWQPRRRSSIPRRDVKHLEFLVKPKVGVCVFFSARFSQLYPVRTSFEDGEVDIRLPYDPSCQGNAAPTAHAVFLKEFANILNTTSYIVESSFHHGGLGSRARLCRPKLSQSNDGGFCDYYHLWVGLEIRKIHQIVC